MRRSVMGWGCGMLGTGALALALACVGALAVLLVATAVTVRITADRREDTDRIQGAPNGRFVPGHDVEVHTDHTTIKACVAGSRVR